MTKLGCASTIFSITILVSLLFLPPTSAEAATIVSLINKRMHSPGEKVIVTLMNVAGDSTATFGSYKVCDSQQNTVVFGPVRSHGTIEPSSSVQIEWDQKDNHGNQVPYPKTYVLFVEEIVGAKIDSINQPIIIGEGQIGVFVKTDKDSYQIGEEVKITLTNTKDTVFSYAAYYIEDAESDTGIYASWADGMIGGDLEPGKSVTFTWKQVDGYGKQVQPATYRVRVLYGFGGASVDYIFQIVNDSKEEKTFLELGIPKDSLIGIKDNSLKAEQVFYIKKQKYSGDNPFIVLVKTKVADDIKKLQIKVFMNFNDISKEFFSENGIVVVPQGEVSGEKEFKIVVILKATPSEKVMYSIAAYAEFEKVDENNIEQIAWAGNTARKEGKLEKTNDEKYYFVLVPQNKKINIKLKCTSARDNETDFDLYVGIAPPQGTGLPRIYKFDYRGFTIDANETVPMKGALGPYNNEIKVYILVRAYQGSGTYDLAIREAYG